MKKLLQTLICLTSTGLALQLQAQTYTYNGTAAGPTTWSSGTSWNAVPVSGNSTSLVFGTTAQSLVNNVTTTQDIASPPFLLNSLTLGYNGGDTTERSVIIQTGAMSFVSNGGTTPTIALNGGNSTAGTARPLLVFNNAVNFGSNITIGGNSSVNFNGAANSLTNTGGAVVTKTGIGTMRIVSTNAGYTGNFNVTGGLLQVGNNGLTGDAGSGTVSLSGGGAFTVRRAGNSTLTLNNTVTGTGAVTFQLGNNGTQTTQVTINKSNTYIGSTTMAATGNATTGGVGIVNLGVNDGLSTSSVLTINNVGPSVQTFNLAGFNQTLGGLATQAGGSATNSKVTLGSGNLTVNDGGNRTFAGEISGAGNVVKQGAGTWTLSSANTYNGTTTISGGTLLLSGGGSIANSSVITVGPSANLNVAAVSGFAIGTGQTLKGNGTVIGNTTINGNLQPGNSPGVLTMNGSLTLNSTATTTMEINGTTRGTDYDGIDLVGPNALTYGGILTLSFGTTFGVGNYTFDLFSFSSTPTGSFANVTLAGNYTGSLTNNSGVWSLTSGNNTWTFTQSTGDLGLSVIPEPTTSLMLAGSLTALVVFRRRRVH